MPIQIKNIDQVRTEVKQFAGNIEESIIEAMKMTGEKFVTDARQLAKDQGGFGDVTGNLRSSIGYAVLKDGNVVIGNFKGTIKGTEAAKKAIEEVSKGSGLKLIGCAGMDYASIVESKGMNVISIQAEAVLVDLKEFIKVIENKHNIK